MSGRPKAIDFSSLDSLEGVAAFEAPPGPPAPSFQARVRQELPGLIVAGVVALAASWLADHYHAPVMLFALLLGTAVNFLSHDLHCRPGLDRSARITIGQIESLGLDVLALAAAGVCLTILVGAVTARAFGLERSFGLLTGGAVAICGASAALAISAVLPRTPHRERDTILTVVGITTLSTIAMVLYPILAQTIGLDPIHAGVFLGATIHDVAQVVGAGYSLSTQSGDTATVVKLFRVALLLPSVLAMSWMYRAEPAGEATRRPPLLPLFLVGFAALVLVNSYAGVITPGVGAWLGDASRWCLVIAISALGVKTSLGDLVRVGWRPIALIVAETMFIGLFVLLALLLHLAG
jgi:uncharacterized integral membrane protein (TIGR00698 family)